MTRLSLGLLLAAAASSALAQGDITFNTYNVDPSKGRVFRSVGFWPGGDGTIPMPSIFVGQLWWSDTSGGTFVAASTLQAFDSIVPGYIFDGSVVIPGREPGSTVWYQVRWWTAAAGADWNTATSSPLLTDYGITQSVRVTLGGIDSDGNVFFPRQANGFRSNGIPEPTTIVLAGLGLASLLICRRRT